MAGECVCRTCGDLFNESELTAVQYAEYAGASMQEEYVSPCCHGGWNYTDTEE